ncbi:methionyl-tRNA formyltransferase [Leifsonia sp. ALI-44-B]|jgi:methionyl-tRNA formyltransferase|uniref:methionyl-tRNA formyltransferase n=1 Tax=Leifsonia sp. ALI-44-B TaxID=1933776 RepID=UPI00097CAE50|nr:methionyl-tRNA formyltransferase [Leifsonia sp. ALI-44-B]ONI63626.1 methionyl-tRNA formyltransferase [Leifsonia sp. ALI-44-B]
MKIVFAGTPAVAVPTLEALVASRHEVVAVITRADAPVGRKRVMTPSPVAAAAERAGLTVIKANRLDDDVTAAIRSLEPDLGVIVAYGGLVKRALLDTPTHGWINLHFSLLPRWRGAAPVQHSLIAGDEETGVSIFQLVPELDAGDIFLRRALPAPDDATAGDLLQAYAAESVPLVLEVVDNIASGTATSEPQSGDVTLAPKLSAADGRLDWSADASRVFAHYRGVTPEPGAHTEITIAPAGGSTAAAVAAGAGAAHVAGVAEPSTTTLKVLELARTTGRGLDAGRLALIDKRVHIGTGSGDDLELVRVQPAGRQAMAAADWWRGLPSGAEISAR